MSIVLLILSLLVGSLLVGRQIVDRAKIQRIIFEFDYYEKAFHQFYDTYRVVPGSLSEKTCEKYSTFKNYYISRNISFNNWTGCKCCTSYGAVLNPKLIESWHGDPIRIKRQAIASGLFEVDWGDGIEQNPMSKCYYGNATTFLSGHWLNNTSASFEATTGKEHRIAFLGFDFQRMLASGETMAHYLNYGFSGSNKYYNANLPHEIENNTFKKQIDHHNVIFYFYHREATDINTNGGSRANEMNTWNGVLSSKLSSQLDSKLDDGRPGTGSILALKSGFGHRSGANADEHIAVCYDRRADEVDKAIYQSDTNMKYGCNIMKIMSDVK